MSRRLDFVAEVRRAVAKHAMLAGGEVGVVAVSGGADSVSLLLALREAGCRLVVAHLDHALRTESADDAEFVRQLSERLGVPCTVERREVAAYRRKRKLSLEEAAREVRHAFLADLAERESAKAIFLGHTADDQVETFLLRLIRGAGVAGLASMRPKDGLLCRPLLGLWRAGVEAYLRERGQEWREDASNTDPAFLRNRVRHELLPLLASMNPGIKRVLAREAELMRQRQLDIEAEVLRRLGLNARQIEAAKEGKAVMVKGGVRLEPPADKIVQKHVEERLPVPGMVDVAGIGTVRAKAVVLPSAEIPARPRNVEYVDPELLEKELRVRTWKPGDRFVPLGMRGEKKLQDFFVDERVPRAQRDRVPLVVSGDAIVWVVGMRINERFKVTPSTTRAIRLQFEPE
jgi:tRNA(Ile)-lysidine synthase